MFIVPGSHFNFHDVIFRAPVRTPNRPPSTSLPISYWINRKAPRYVTPGIRTVNIIKPSGSGGSYHSTAHYDAFGRLIGRTDRTNHGYSNPNSPQFHPNPHHHRIDPLTNTEIVNPDTGTGIWPGLFGN